MFAWRIEIEVAEGEDPPAGDERVDGLRQLLEPFAATVGGTAAHYYAMLTVEARTAESAINEAVRVFRSRADRAGLPDLPIVKLSAGAADATPAWGPLPRLLGVAELAALLGVTKQRASGLARSATFPPPVADLAAGPVWSEPAVNRFLRTWKRKPGRPSSQPAGSDR